MHSIGRMAERKRRGELADKRSVASSVGGAVALQPIAEGQRLLAPERGAVDDARRRRCEVGSSVALCLGTIGFVPVVNKDILAADGPLRAAPLSMTAVQLAGAFVVFATLTLCRYARRGPPGESALRRRARRLLPLGLAFGLKVGASNVGLGLVSTELHVLLGATEVVCRVAQESEIPNFKGSDLGRFPLVSADLWTSDHLLERSRSVDAFSGTRARGTLTLKRT
jgi:hypothetical protein